VQEVLTCPGSLYHSSSCRRSGWAFFLLISAITSNTSESELLEQVLPPPSDSQSDSLLLWLWHSSGTDTQQPGHGQWLVHRERSQHNHHNTDLWSPVYSGVWFLHLFFNTSCSCKNQHLDICRHSAVHRVSLPFLHCHWLVHTREVWTHSKDSNCYWKQVDKPEHCVNLSALNVVANHALFLTLLVVGQGWSHS
jgi:hypothetical protein